MTNDQITEYSLYLILASILLFGFVYFKEKIFSFIESILNKRKPMQTNGDFDRNGNPYPHVWIPLLLKEMYHLLIVSETRSGKTVLVEALTRYLDGIGKAYMISPKIQKWNDKTKKGNIPGRGYGANFADILVAFKEIDQVLRNRIAVQAEDNSVEFEPLYLIIDEYTYIKDNVPETVKYMKTFANVGAEYQFYLIVINQSGNVDDLGVSAPLRKNFSRIFMQSEARKLMPHMFERKDERPLVLEIKGDTISLSSIGLLDITKTKYSDNIVYDLQKELNLHCVAQNFLHDLSHSNNKPVENKMSGTNITQQDIEDYTRVAALLARNPKITYKEIANKGVNKPMREMKLLKNEVIEILGDLIR